MSLLNLQSAGSGVVITVTLALTNFLVNLTYQKNLNALKSGFTLARVSLSFLVNFSMVFYASTHKLNIRNKQNLETAFASNER